MATLTLTARLGLSLAQEQLVLQLQQSDGQPDDAANSNASPNSTESNPTSASDINYLAYYLLAKS